ncbi:class I SAM-dependent methyltransferase [Sphaerisporangium fuscum]|uniref:class I SAM-dependent methyltransferase n=1 Tax=Sphaerisporangium fuscum TaxID=2835868 RepID=UPI001BDCB3D7|nr:methyltransferase domain-containing protein [Sphaerisporangium fuscum]
MVSAERMAEAFDELAGGYDDDHHDEIAHALLELVAPGEDGEIADVACGTGAVALAVAGNRRPGASPILAVDLSEGMVAAGRARAVRLGRAQAIDWRVGPAVPLPVADGSLDLVLCASSLHFLGMRALTDWRRALRPGGRVGFTLPVASQFRPSGTFAALVATDLPLPRTSEDAVALATAAGFTEADAREITVGSRSVVLTVATSRTPLALS